MKTRLFTISLLATLTVSCSIQEVDQNSEYYPTDQVFYAKMEVPAGDVETKVYVDDDLMVLWHADDRVSIFNKYTFNQEYRFTGKTGDNSGAFKKVESDDFITGNVLDNVYAVYPYQESTEISNQGVLTVTLPATQAYVKDSFGPGANTMISCSENNELIFKNLCGYAMLKLYGDNVAVKSISIKGNNDEPLAGTATVNAAVDATPTLKFASDASKEITLTFDSPVTIGSTEKTATTFWLVVPPTTFSKGFTLTVKDSKNWGFEKTTSSSFKVERNSLARMAALEVIPEEPDASEEPIVFADQGIKEALVAKFDSNGDGELSYKEAAAVTSIEGVFGSTKSYTSFEEFQYFTGVTVIPPSMFEGWQIKSIVLPESVVTIGAGAFIDCLRLTSVSIPSLVHQLPREVFKNCISLSSISLPSSIIEIGYNAFYRCSQLSSITIPTTVTTIGENAFCMCSSLKTISIPDSVTKIMAGTFSHCTSLESIVIPESITEIGRGAFRNCSSLTSITIPNQISVLEQEVFASCSNLVTVSLPEYLTKIVGLAFYQCSSLSSVVIPKTITKIGSTAFGLCEKLSSITIKAEYPPLAETDMFWRTNNCPIFVPAESVEAYKAAEYWSDYADRIQAIGTPMAVDLGLPSGLKWASFNLGATAPEEFGDYFAWGETELKENYIWATYIMRNRTENSLIKYNTNDNKTTLEPIDDAAHVFLGGSWRMPTQMEFEELTNNCTVEWTPLNGINGCRFTSKIEGYLDKSIFFPAAGCKHDGYIQSTNSIGFYWSSSLRPDYPTNAFDIYLADYTYDYVNFLSSSRYIGESIRPVTD